MSTTSSAAVVAACLLAAVMLGWWLHRCLPEHHLSAESRDTVKLAMGLVATMTALLLGLLVSSAKATYDSARSEVMQMASKAAFLDRVLALYGPEATPLRGQFREIMHHIIRETWPAAHTGARLAPDPQAGNTMFFALQNLPTHDDAQRTLKTQATTTAMEFAQLRTLLVAQSVPSISKPVLFVVVSWLIVIFLSFSVVAPPNATALLALLVSALSVSGAVFLILELDRPFGGLIQISSEPLAHALDQALTAPSGERLSFRQLSEKSSRYRTLASFRDVARSKAASDPLAFQAQAGIVHAQWNVLDNVCVLRRLPGLVLTSLGTVRSTVHCGCMANRRITADGRRFSRLQTAAV